MMLLQDHLICRISQHLNVHQNGEEVVLKTTVRGLNPQLARHALYDEPRGSVGRRWRTFFLCYYGPFLMRKPVKVRALQICSTRKVNGFSCCHSKCCTHFGATKGVV